MAPQRKVRILSIDGGGIRGILPGVILEYIEAQLVQRTQNENARISDYFDFIAGTSTGGILTCLYLTADRDGRPRYSAKDAVDLYLENGQQIFDRTLIHRVKTMDGLIDEKYDAKGLEGLASTYFSDTRLSHLLKPCLITSYNIEKRAAHFFTSHDADSDIHDYFVRDVARATSAAPTYFECAHIKSVFGSPYALADGGVFANNPALCAYSEVRNMNVPEWGMDRPRAAQMMMVSIGTGSTPESFQYESAKDWGKVEWIQPVIDIMMSGNSETVDYQLKMLFDAADAAGQYYRIEPDLFSADSKMDNADPKNLRALKEAGLKSVSEHKETLDKVVDDLIRYAPPNP